METIEQVDKLKAYVAETFQGLHYDIKPRYPYILVRLIPKETNIELGNGKILWLPDTAKGKQNKPVYEGQVLRTYEPFEKLLRTKYVEEGLAHFTKEEWTDVKSELQPGDHVVFQHHWGVPVPKLCHDWKVGEYRLVEEQNIIGVLEYEKDSVYSKLRTLFSGAVIQEDKGDIQSIAVTFVNDLLDQADVIFHERAKTLSGK